jgi:hypothetical protein
MTRRRSVPWVGALLFSGLVSASGQTPPTPRPPQTYPM